MVRPPALRIVPREHQRAAVEFFFQHAGQAAEEGRPLRMQLAWHSGKRYTYAMIVYTDLLRNPAGRYVVFVRRLRDVAEVHRVLASFGIRAAVVGPGQDRIPRSSVPVLICPYSRAFRLARHERFRIKIVDEARYLRDTYSTTMVHRGVPAALSLEMSSNFQPLSRVDFEYDFESAVRDGYAREVKREYVLMDGRNFQEEVLDLIVRNRTRCAPAVVVFCNGSEARSGAERLRSAGLSAVSISVISDELDQKLFKDMANGRLEVVCAVSIHLRVSKFVEAAQTAVVTHSGSRGLDVSSLHRALSKRRGARDSGLLVLPIDVHSILGGSDALPTNSTSRVLPRRHVHSHPAVDSMELKAGLLGVVADHNPKSSLFDIKLRLLRQSVEELGHLPSPSFQDREQRHLRMTRWLRQLGRKFQQGTLPSDKIARLSEVPGMPALVQEWKQRSMARSGGRRWLQLLRAYAERHGGALPRNGSSVEDQRVATILRAAIGAWQRDELAANEMREVQALFGVQSLQAGLDWSARFPKSPAEAQRAAWMKRYGELFDWLHAGNPVPSVSSLLSGKNGRRQNLAIWLKALRQQCISGSLSKQRQDLLAALPLMDEVVASWREDASSSGLGPWERTAIKLATWVERRGRAPKRRGKAMPTEVVLAHWLRRAYQDYLSGSLSSAQAKQLLAIPCVAESWKSEAVIVQGESWAKDLDAWANSHGGSLPSDTEAEDPEEQRLAFCRLNAQRLARYGLGREDDPRLQGCFAPAPSAL